MRKRSSSWRRLQWITAGVLTIYFAVGVLSFYAPARWLPHEQLYPFFHWFLFRKVVNVEYRHTVRLLQVAGQNTTSPVLFERAGELVRQPHSIDIQYVFRRLAAAIHGKDESEVEKLLRLLDDFIAPPARYELVRLKYKPLERWLGGGEDVKFIREFIRPGTK